MRRKRELILSSRKDSIRTIEEFSERVSDEYFLNDSYFGNIITCLTEAVTNAITHGNKLDKNKSVNVLLEEKKEGLLFTVTDHGEGYDYQQYTGDINSESEGKGLYIIHHLADEVHITNKGRVISMLFRITGIEQKVAEERARILRDYHRTTSRIASKNLD